jgi:uncharacterized protein (DUF58 family)
VAVVQPLLPASLLHRLERLQLVSNARLTGTARGERRSRHKGSSLQFVDYREYNLGDDPRQVDWNAYGRSGHLYVKLYEDEALLDVHLCVDVSRSMDWGEPNKLDAARRLAAALGYVALARFDRVQATALDDGAHHTVGPVWGRDAAPRLFDGIAAWRAVGPTDLEAALRSYVGRAGKSPGMAIVISDLLSPTWEGGLRALLRHRHEVALIHLLAPEEITPPIGEELRLLDRETGRHVEIHLDAFALDAYAQRFATWTTAIERFCADHRICYARVDSDTSVETAVFEVFRKRRICQ